MKFRKKYNHKAKRVFDAVGLKQEEVMELDKNFLSIFAKCDTSSEFVEKVEQKTLAAPDIMIRFLCVQYMMSTQSSIEKLRELQSLIPEGMMDKIKELMEGMK